MPMLQMRQLRLSESECAKSRSQEAVRPGWALGPLFLLSLLPVGLPPRKELLPPPLESSEPLTSSSKPSVTCHSLPPSTGDGRRDTHPRRMSAPTGPSSVFRSFSFAWRPRTRVAGGSQHTAHFVNHPDFPARRSGLHDLHVSWHHNEAIVKTAQSRIPQASSSQPLRLG